MGLEQRIPSLLGQGDGTRGQFHGGENLLMVTLPLRVQSLPWAMAAQEETLSPTLGIPVGPAPAQAPSAGCQPPSPTWPPAPASSSRGSSSAFRRPALEGAPSPGTQRAGPGLGRRRGDSPRSLTQGAGDPEHRAARLPAGRPHAQRSSGTPDSGPGARPRPVNKRGDRLPGKGRDCPRLPQLLPRPQPSGALPTRCRPPGTSCPARGDGSAPGVWRLWMEVTHPPGAPAGAGWGRGTERYSPGDKAPRVLTGTYSVDSWPFARHPSSA